MRTIFICMVTAFCIATLTRIQHLQAVQLAVIVHPGNPTAALTIKEVKRIYLAKQKTFGNGARIVPINNADKDLKKEFYKKVVKKTLSQLKAFWAKRIFTGKGKPPRSSSDVLGWVSSHKNGIGFVRSDQVNGSVKVVLQIP